MKIEKIQLNDEYIKELIELSRKWKEEDCSYGMVINTKDDIHQPIYIAIEENKIIGYIFGHYYIQEKHMSAIDIGTKCFMVDELYVLPEYRNQGIGHILFHTLETEAKELVQYLTLNTSTKDYHKILYFYVEELDMNFHSAFLFKKY